jgi:hypothetical protein
VFRRTILDRCALSFFILIAPALFASVQFQPPSQEELKMTSEPQAPGAPAIILFHEVNRDDFGRSSHGGLRIVGDESGDTSDRYEENYFRIKVLTEEGRKYGNIEIRYDSGIAIVNGIVARTIHPDGSIVNFHGQVLEKTIVRNSRFKYVAKTFAMPDVQVGSIIEYYYTLSFKEGFFYSSHWVLNDDLFTRHAKFSLKPNHYDYTPVSFRWVEKLPPGTPSPKEDALGIIRLEVSNIPAFQTEDFMPPENELKARVDFVYSYEPFETDAAKFWKKVGKKRNAELESFVSRRGTIEQALSQIVSASDSPEDKLKKIYARVQQLHEATNQTHVPKTSGTGDNRKTDQYVDDVWKNGTNDSRHLNWVFLALARAAGFDANGVLVSDRKNYFFSPQEMQSGQLDASAVVVKLSGKDLFLSPGNAFTPYGMLPWDETGVQGLRLDKDGGSWVQTALPESSASRIERNAKLKLSPSGDLEGTFVLTFTGLEAQRRRVEEMSEDESGRKRFLEDEVKAEISVGSNVDLTRQPEWSNPEMPLVAEFKVQVPGWATSVGRRALFPVGLFGASEKHVFDHSERVHPIYFDFLDQKLDDVTVELPPGWQITGLPKPQNQDLHVVGYATSVENKQGTLHLTRKLDINILTVDTKYYSPLRSFFQIVRAGDEQQVVLLPGTAPTAN